MMQMISNLWKRGQVGTSIRLALCLVAFPVYALAAEGTSGTSAVGIDFGQVILMGDFGRVANDKMGFRFTYEYDASETFGLLAHLGYSAHSNQDDSNKLTLWSLAPNLKVNFAIFDKLVLYGFGGFGLNRTSLRQGSTLDGAVTTFGLNLGAGFQLDLAQHFRFGSNLSLHNVFGGNDANAGPGGLSIGGTYATLYLTAAYVF